MKKSYRKPPKPFTVEDDIAFLIKYRKDFIDKMGQEKYDKVMKELIDYQNNKKVKE